MASAERPLISIIIPTYNSEATLAISLESVASQLFSDVEVIIMDGLSQDNTLEVAESFKGKIPGLKIFSEKDEGIYDAMNKALLKVTGAWVLFLGSDDSLFSHNVLEEISEKIQKTNAKVLYGNAHIIGDTGWAKDGDLYAGNFTITKLLNQNICHQAMFYNMRFVIDEIGMFNTKYTKSSDWDFNIRCWAKKPFEYVNSTVANFVAGGFSTDSNDIAFSEDYVENVLGYFKISPFHSLVNRNDFVYYAKVLTLQREKHPLLFKFNALKNRIFRKFNKRL